MRRFMGFVGKWLFRILLVVLLFLILPHASRLLNTFLGGTRAQTVTISEILERRMRASKRLETSVIEDTGVLTSSVDAFLIGTVQKVTIHYLYHASLGVDLEKVCMRVEDGHITLGIPPLEVLSDSLTPTSVDRQDFWYPLTEARRNTLLAEEREKCRAHYLAQTSEAQQAWTNTEKAINSLILAWTDTLGQVEVTLVPLSEMPQDEASSHGIS